MGKISFVTGKGGVGKSTVALALAYHLSSQNQKTLLVEMGKFSHFQEMLGKTIGYKPQILQKNLEIAHWTADQCLREYVIHLLKLESFYNLLFDNKVSRTLLQAAPAIHEIALLGKITSQQRKIGPSMDYDHIVVDSYASGHFTALLKAPIGLSSVVPLGAMKEQCDSIRQVLNDPKLTDYYVVSLPEELTFIEALDLESQIKKLSNAQPYFVLNKKLDLKPSLFAKEETQKDWKIFQDFLHKQQRFNYAHQKDFDLEIPFIFDELHFIDQLKKISIGLKHA